MIEYSLKVGIITKRQRVSLHFSDIVLIKLSVFLYHSTSTLFLKQDTDDLLNKNKMLFIVWQ